MFGSHPLLLVPDRSPAASKVGILHIRVRLRKARRKPQEEAVVQDLAGAAEEASSSGILEEDKAAFRQGIAGEEGHIQDSRVEPALAPDIDPNRQAEAASGRGMGDSQGKAAEDIVERGDRSESNCSHPV